MKRPSIAIVGPGRLGTALALSLKQADYRIVEVVGQRNSRSLSSARSLARRIGARATHMENAKLDADLVWLCVPDSKIADVAAELSGKTWRGKIALHPSGVRTSDALASLRKRDASVASLHPLMTFVPGSTPDLSGVMFAAEGDTAALRVARKMVRDLGGELVVLGKGDKAAYHAFATIICPLLVSLLASAERVAGLAGINRKQARRRMLPIIEQTLQNYARLGPEKAFTGPIGRGDLETIRLHLEALERVPAARDAYEALARAAVEYLPSQNRQELKVLLRQKPTS